MTDHRRRLGNRMEGAPPATSRRRFIESMAALTATAWTSTVGEGQAAVGPAAGGATVERVRAGVLDVAYLESGPRDGAAVLLLHGFPYDVRSYAEVAPLLARAGRRVIVPYLRGCGPTRFLDGSCPRVGQQAALGGDLLALLDALGIERATLAGYDWGGRAACVVAALHPERVRGLVSGGTGYNIQNSAEVLRPVDPGAEQRHWYWFYLSSTRGRAALSEDRFGYCRHLWRTFSPAWAFSDAEYARTASSFDNPDFVEVVLHSYGYRIGAAAGDPALGGVETRLSATPKIVVPTIVLEGADDGVDPPAAPDAVAPHFPALRRQTSLPGVGHNIPQEAPDRFAAAILELDG